MKWLKPISIGRQNQQNVSIFHFPLRRGSSGNLIEVSAYLLSLFNNIIPRERHITAVTITWLDYSRKYFNI